MGRLPVLALRLGVALGLGVQAWGQFTHSLRIELAQGTLTLCEVEMNATVADGDAEVPLVLFDADASSSVNTVFGFADRAIDGDTSGDFFSAGGGSCSHTGTEDVANLFWSASFNWHESAFRPVLANLRITNRRDCCPERLLNITARVVDGASGEDSVSLPFDNGGAVDGANGSSDFVVELALNLSAIPANLTFLGGDDEEESGDFVLLVAAAAGGAALCTAVALLLVRRARRRPRQHDDANLASGGGKDGRGRWQRDAKGKPFVSATLSAGSSVSSGVVSAGTAGTTGSPDWDPPAHDAYIVVSADFDAGSHASLSPNVGTVLKNVGPVHGHPEFVIVMDPDTNEQGIMPRKALRKHEPDDASPEM